MIDALIMNIVLSDKQEEAEMGSTKYITSMGELTRKDNSLCFRKNGKIFIFQLKIQKKFIA